MTAVKCGSGISILNVMPFCAKVGSKRSVTACSMLQMFCTLNLTTILRFSTLLKSSSWFTNSSSRLALRSMILRLLRSESESGALVFNNFSNGPMMSDTGVRISWAMVVKNCILEFLTSSSFSSFSFSICASCLLRSLVSV